MTSIQIGLVQRIIVLTAATFLVTGCNRNYTVQDYVAPTAEDMASIKVVSDKFRNQARIKVSLAERSSCDSKYLFQNLTELRSSTVWKEGVKEASFQIPANKIANIHIFNISATGFVEKSCSNLKAYSLTSEDTYLMKVKNWSSKKTGTIIKSSFGCEFDILDSNGAVVATTASNLPTCAN